jgi:hypothetical protein
MATTSTRNIDWTVGRLSGGFTSSRRTVPAHHGSLRPCDWKLEESEEGPLSERGEELARDLAAYEARMVRPILASLAPISTDQPAFPVNDTLPLSFAPAMPAARKRPSRALNAFWSASAAVMSILALGLVVKLGFESVAQASMVRPPAAAFDARTGSNEGVPFAPRAPLTLDPVFIDGVVTAPVAVPPVHHSLRVR